MAYLFQSDLEKMGFAHLGHNVKISTKASLYGTHEMSIGDNSRIDDFCVVSGKLEIGRNVHIAPFCLVAGGRPGIVLEDFSGLAYHAQVFAQSDNYSGTSMTNPTVPAAYKTEIEAPVWLGRHAIIGAGAVIVPGVTVAEGSSIGALALVLKSTEPWSIYAGCPARKLKNRSRKLLSMEKKYLSETE